MLETERAHAVLDGHHGTAMAAGASVGHEWQTKPARKQSAWAYCCLKCLPKHGDRAWNRPANSKCHICQEPKPAIPLYYAELDAKHKEEHAKGGKAAGGKGKGKADGKGKAVGKGKGKGKGGTPALESVHTRPGETPLQQAQCKLLSVETVMLDAGVKTEDFHTKPLWRAASASVEALKPVAVPTTRVADTPQVASWKQELALSIPWRTGESADNAAIHARCTELEAWIEGAAAAAATAAAAAMPLGSAALKKAEQARDAAGKADDQAIAAITKAEAQLEKDKAAQLVTAANRATAEAAVVDCKRRVASGTKGAIVSENQLACIATQVASLDTTMQGARSALVREDVRAQLPPAARNSIEGMFDAVQFLVAALTPEMRRPISTSEAPIVSAGAGVPTLATGSVPPTPNGVAAATAGAGQLMPAAGAGPPSAVISGLTGGPPEAVQDVAALLG